ncbi:MAG TPA: methyltransferase domain-containing protein [Acidimicrobiales bacterium]|nr:methyltransferase domain-containing protein [Acidimicrobiales bacterium]
MLQRRAIYTHGHHESVLRSHTWRDAANSAGYLLGLLRPDMSLLDVGCGPGTITADLATYLPAGRVVGVDTSEEVVGLAESAAERVRSDGRPAATIELEVADASALPYPDGSFDVVHAHQLLQHLGDPIGALVEMRRVCRPGGIVAARDADYSAMTWFPRDPLLDRWLELYHAAARRNGAEPDAGRHLLAWAHAAGMADVSATASAWCFATPSDRAWWGGLWADRVTSSALATQLVGSALSTEHELGEIAGAWHSWAADPDGWFALLHGEILCRV